MKQHKTHTTKHTSKRVAPKLNKTKEEFFLDIVRDSVVPQKGQKYLELESVMSFPVSISKQEIIGKIVTNDDHTIAQGIVSNAKKEGRAKEGMQKWRVISQITDEKFIEMFSVIPAFKKKIKVMK